MNAPSPPADGRRYLRPGALPHMWCPGCGIGIMLGALLRAFEELSYGLSDTVVVTGIGCTGKLDDYLRTNALHTTHGRALAFATGIKAFRPALHVVAVMGDGDAVTIGGNHFIHAARRNIDVTALVLNNFNFGMTGGQVSGTTPAGSLTSTTAFGNPERDFDICALAEAAGANFVARATPDRGREMQALIREALSCRGFALVEVVSPCPTHFGRRNAMRETPAMLRWLKERALPAAEFRRLSPAEAAGRFPVGRLVVRDHPDFNTRYAAVQQEAARRAGSETEGA